MSNKYYNNQKNLLFKISSYLFLSIPILLVTGPFLSDLALSLVSIFFLFKVIKFKKYEYFNNKFFIYFLIFYVYLIINSIFQNQNIDSFRISITYIRFGLFSLAVVYLLNHDDNILKKLFYVFLIIFTILVFDGFYQFYNGKNILGFILDASSGPRVSSFFNEELILGSYLSRLFPIFFGLMVYVYNEIKKTTYYYSLFLFILSEILIYLSGERAAFFYMNLSSLFILLFIRKFRKIRLIIMSLSLICIVVISHSFPSTKNRVIDKTVKQMRLKSDSIEKILIFSEQHDDIIRTAFKIAKDNIFFGVGVKNFRHFCSYDEYEISIYSCNNHPHNTYVQLLSELGLLGLFFGIFSLYILSKFTIIHFFRLFKKNYYFDDFQVCLIAAILITLWPFVPSGNFFNNWLSIIYYFPVGILLWSLNKNKKIA